MSRYGLIRVVLVAAVFLMAAAVWGVGRIQTSADDNATRAINAGEQMLIAMLDQETGLRGYINARQPRFLQPYRAGRQRFESAIAEARSKTADAIDRKLLNGQIAIARHWQNLAENQLSSIEAGRRTTIESAVGRKAVMDEFRKLNADYTADKQADRTADQARATRATIALILALGLLFLLLGWHLFERPARRDARRRRRLAQFGDALQVARSEGEAFGVLKRHLEGWVKQARAVVMVRNASHNRLEAATSVETTPLLAEQLESAAPE